MERNNRRNILKEGICRNRRRKRENGINFGDIQEIIKEIKYYQLWLDYFLSRLRGKKKQTIGILKKERKEGRKRK